jgi:SAM-dependent methyltransferase
VSANDACETAPRGGAPREGSRTLRALAALLPPTARQLARGIQSCLPGGSRAWRNTGGTDTAPYCYEVFLKHLTLCHEAGMRSIPSSVAEIGPGDSIGIGLAALIAGADRYSGLDVVPYSLSDRNHRIFRDLVAFFRDRKPNAACGWPRYDHLLDARLFPSAALPDGALRRSLAAERLEAISAALGGRAERVRIEYRCPWSSAAAIEPGSVDWLWSHSVLEHVDDLEAAYAAMHRWLRPGGFTSHQIDLRSHELLPEWNGHWGVPGWQWRVMRGRRLYLINRQPFSAHARLVRRFFDVRTELTREDPGGIGEARFRPPFDRLDPRERRTSGYFVVAVKR